MNIFSKCFAGHALTISYMCTIYVKMYLEITLHSNFSFSFNNDVKIAQQTIQDNFLPPLKKKD